MGDKEHWLWSSGVTGLYGASDTPSSSLSRALAPDGDPDRSAAAARNAVSEQLREAQGLLRRLMKTNVRSMQIAKDLLLAQELADLHTGNVEPAIDAAAESGGDPEAIERAVAVVAAAGEAEEEEFALSREWGAHCGEVYALLEVAEDLLTRPPRVASEVSGSRLTEITLVSPPPAR